ncbi:hypothetical protein [Hymenobacter nivis]|uniref:hypothetical protein n=1 Tax=Hymenobacter nivis TaxID=1850093 RepID=UPI0013A56177|nr:hypothetical protein [Hymenobacter nivis]
MPEATEFEEKEYENPLNHQLLLKSNNLWTPGQVFEKAFGIDSALLALNYNFWAINGYDSIPEGVFLNTYNWDHLWTPSTRARQRFPSFKLNVLIQAKRPEYRLGINSDYANYGIKNHYWQFSVTKHQQEILEQVETALASDALVTYACPTFHKFSELDNHISSGGLVSNSTFVKPSILKDHKRWIYDQPGTTGLGCSKIERYSDISFEQQIQELFIDRRIEINDDSDTNQALQNLLQLEKIAISICEEVNQNNAIAAAFLRRRQILLPEINTIGVDVDAIRSFLTFKLFVSTTNTLWMTS